MSATSTIIRLGLFKLSLNPLASAACSDLSLLITDANDIVNGESSGAGLATFEPDAWLLDGSRKLLNDAGGAYEQYFGVVSSALSDAAGDFVSPPTITITLSADSDTTGLTVCFAEVAQEWATSMRVQYYDAVGALMENDLYTVAAATFSTEKAVTGFRSIVLTFYSTNKAYRFLKVSTVDFGNVVTFAGADVLAGNVVEEINPLSIELPAGSATVRIHTTSFDPTDPTGPFGDLEAGQPLDIYEQVDVTSLFLGRFFLDKWKAGPETEIQFDCSDTIARLGEIEYADEDTYTLSSAKYTGEICGTYLPPASIHARIVVEDATYNARALLGPLNAGYPGQFSPVRSVLQQVGFNASAWISAARSRYVFIEETPKVADVTDFDAIITAAQIALGKELTIKPVVSGVEVTFHYYDLVAYTYVTVWSGNLAAGVHTIVCPLTDYAYFQWDVTGATVQKGGLGWVRVSVASPGTVTVKAYRHTERTVVNSVYSPTYDASVKQSVLRFEVYWASYSTGGQDIAQRIYDYFQQRYSQHVKLFAPTVRTGQFVKVATFGGKQVAGMIERMEMDLTGGFTAEVDIVGDLVTP